MYKDCKPPSREGANENIPLLEGEPKRRSEMDQETGKLMVERFWKSQYPILQSVAGKRISPLRLIEKIESGELDHQIWSKCSFGTCGKIYTTQWNDMGGIISILRGQGLCPECFKKLWIMKKNEEILGGLVERIAHRLPDARFNLATPNPTADVACGCGCKARVRWDMLRDPSRTYQAAQVQPGQKRYSQFIVECNNLVVVADEEIMEFSTKEDLLSFLNIEGGWGKEALEKERSGREEFELSSKLQKIPRDLHKKLFWAREHIAA